MRHGDVICGTINMSLLISHNPLAVVLALWQDANNEPPRMMFNYVNASEMLQKLGMEQIMMASKDEAK